MATTILQTVVYGGQCTVVLSGRIGTLDPELPHYPHLSFFLKENLNYTKLWRNPRFYIPILTNNINDYGKIEIKNMYNNL